MRRETYAEGWRLYPWSMIGHHAQGTAVAIGAALQGFVVLAAIWTACYLAYQGLSAIRKRDSPGLDIVDFMAGLAIGAPIAVWIG